MPTSDSRMLHHRRRLHRRSLINTTNPYSLFGKFRNEVEEVGDDLFKVPVGRGLRKIGSAQLVVAHTAL